MTAEGARERIAKLMAIYEDRPTTPEGLNALKHAKRLIAKYRLDHPKEMTAQAANPEVARLFSAFQQLLTTKPKPRNQGVPDIGELERKLTQLLKGQHP